jgi:hypothetical protein
MKSLKSILSLSALVTTLFLSSCGEDDPKPALEATTFTNLAADPATGFNPNTGQATGTTGKFKFFSFKTGDVVANTDSATNKWDLGFRGTTIIVNSGTSGPGNGAAQVYTGIFDELQVAPDAGYNVDNKTATPAYAIPIGSGNGWYTATGGGPTSPTVITPTAGKFIVLKTADGKFAKLEILSYYKDAPATPTGTEPARYYTFRYIYQPDGSKNLK